MLRSGKRERERTVLDKTRKEVRHAHYILYICIIIVLYTSIYECVARLTIICISIERPGYSSKNIKWQEICTAGDVLVRFFSTSPLIVAKFRVQDTLLLKFYLLYRGLECFLKPAVFTYFNPIFYIYSKYHKLGDKFYHLYFCFASHTFSREMFF